MTGRVRIVVQAEYQLEEGETPSDIATSLECLDWRAELPPGIDRAVFKNVCVWLEPDLVAEVDEAGGDIGRVLRAAAEA